MRKLQTDLDTKLAQRDELKEKRRWQKEGINPDDVGSEGGDEEEIEGNTMEESDLFGEGPDVNMDIGQ